MFGSATALAATSRPSLLQRQFHALFLARNQFVLRDNASASVPAQQGIIVPRRTDRLRLFKPAHRFAKTIVSIMTRPRSALRKSGLGAAFRQNSSVIRALIFAFHSRKELLRLCVTDSISFAESIGYSQ